MSIIDSSSPLSRVAGSDNTPSTAASAAVHSCAIETLALRSGQIRSAEREHSEPLFATSSFVFDSAEQAAALFADDEQGNIYSRFTNPTVAAFERRLAAMENATCCIATSSGMAAICGLVLSTLKPGDHIIASWEMFGSTVSLFNKVFSRFNIDLTLVTVDDTDAWRQAVTPHTRMLFLETPSNPLCRVGDIAALAAIAHDADAVLVVDNCFCTPVLQRPLTLGADVVIHTATKYIDGQGRCVGGAMVTNDAQIHDRFFAMLRTTGPSMSPFNAWVFLKGLETLPLRMRQHCANAMEVARWLERNPDVQEVFYPGLTHHRGHNLSSQQQSDYGGVVSFRIGGERSRAWKLINATSMLSITANLGDARTTITHPASTTHARISADERSQAGVTEDLVRLSIGLENAGDIISDLERGLSTAYQGS